MVSASSVQESRDALRSDVSAFVAEWRESGRFVPRLDSWMRSHNRDFSKALGERGWIGVTWPTEFGGGGQDNISRLIITEELLRGGAPVAAHWFADRQIGPAILRFGSSELQREFLPRIARGETTFCVCMSETEAGSDLAAVRTKARLEGGTWLINGHKIWTTYAHVSDFAYVLARTDDSGPKHVGLTEFIVDMSDPGVTVRPILDLNGEHHFNEVFFEDVPVDPSRVIGDVGSGWQQVTEQLSFERGGAERVLSVYPLLVAILDSLTDGDVTDLAVDTFGRLAARLAGLRQMTWNVALALDAGQAPKREAAVLKYLGTRFEQDTADALRRAFDIAPDSKVGVAGLLSQALMASPAFTIQGGTTEMLLTIISRSEISS